MSATTLSRHEIFRRRALAALSGVLFLTLAGPALSPADAVSTTAPRTSSYGVSADKLDPALPRSGSAPVDVLVSGRPGQSSTVARSVRDHGGTVTSESTPGEGTRFVVSLPVVTAPAEP